MDVQQRLQNMLKLMHMTVLILQMICLRMKSNTGECVIWTMQLQKDAELVAKENLRYVFVISVWAHDMFLRIFWIQIYKKISNAQNWKNKTKKKSNVFRLAKRNKKFMKKKDIPICTSITFCCIVPIFFIFTSVE